MFYPKVLIYLLTVLPWTFLAQQVSDKDYLPSIVDPAYDTGTGPQILIDAGHHNFHTADGRYQPFAQLLRRDGYQIDSFRGQFKTNALEVCKILVISNALHERKVNDWTLPNYSAFTDDEIRIVDQWVQRGGSLFLIADHMPMGGAAKSLASAFGFDFTDGFAMDTSTSGPSQFSAEMGAITENVITEGRYSDEAVTSVLSFTGQAFRCPPDAHSILNLDERFVNFLPDTAWVFNEATRRMPADGWSQGAFKRHGEGRVVVFGEAAMFTAQLAGPQRRKMGMNHPEAKQNYQLLLNIVHWLDGLIP